MTTSEENDDLLHTVSGILGVAHQGGPGIGVIGNGGFAVSGLERADHLRPARFQGRRDASGVHVVDLADMGQGREHPGQVEVVGGVSFCVELGDEVNRCCDRLRLGELERNEPRCAVSDKRRTIECIHRRADVFEMIVERDVAHVCDGLRVVIAAQRGSAPRAALWPRCGRNRRCGWLLTWPRWAIRSHHARPHLAVRS